MSATLKRPREPHKGRTLPTEPFHMNTRRGGKPFASTTASPSGSFDENASRRDSSGSLQSETSDHSTQEPPAKRLRTSSEPISLPIGDAKDADYVAGRDDDGSIEDQRPYVERSPDPSFPQHHNSDYITTDAPSPSHHRHRSWNAPLSYYVVSDGAGDEDEAAPPSPPQHQPDGSASSGGSSDSGAAYESAGKDLVAPSTDVTPAASAPGSPASTPGSFNNNIAAKLADASSKPYDGEVDETLNADDTELVDVDDADEIDEGVKSDEGRPRRRFPGKRRANHPNPAIEAALRRQLELKTGFRAISRCLKPVLSQIAKRTLRDLHQNEKAHEAANEHSQVQEHLRSRLEDRQAYLHRQREMNAAQLSQRLEAEVSARKDMCRLELENIRDETLGSLELDLLRIARDMGMSDVEAPHDTEDEGEIVPRLHGQDYKFRRKGYLDPVYESRSRVAVEALQAFDDLERRLRMRQMLRDRSAQPGEGETGGFTVMDTAHRNLAVAKRASRSNAMLLAEAAVEYERRNAAAALEAEQAAFEEARRKSLLVPNEMAYGLQLLSDTATRPSLAAPWPSHHGPQVPGHHPSHISDLPPGGPVGYHLPPFAPTHPLLYHRDATSIHPPIIHAFDHQPDRGMLPPSTPKRTTKDLFVSPHAQARDPTTHVSPIDVLSRQSQDRMLPPVVSSQSSRHNSLSLNDSGPGQSQQRGQLRQPDGQPTRERQSNLMHILQSPEAPTVDKITTRYGYELSRPSNLDESSRSHSTRVSMEREGLFVPPDHRLSYSRSQSENVAAVDLAGGKPVIKHRSATFSDLSPHNPQPYSILDTSMSALQRRPISPPALEHSRTMAGAVKEESPRGHTPPIATDPHDDDPTSEKHDHKKLPAFSSKTNREERGGQSRKQWKQKHRQHKSTSGPNPSGSSPGKTPASIGSNSNLPSRPSWGQLHATQGSPLAPSTLPYPPPQTHATHPPPPAFWTAPHSYQSDYYNHLAHRNSFPLQGAPPGPALPPWGPPPPPQSPPNPLFAMPRGSQVHPPTTSLPPPPPGMTHEPFHAPFLNPGPPLPGFSPTAPIALPSTHPGQQYGGPTLAPAAPDPRYGPAFSYGPTPPPSLPAFAQQQRQERFSGDGFRKRHQSEGGQQGLFRPWFPDQRR
ncbi:hypothetical protein K431DRAFT_58924 [Polychaeton citri CBS 116435]|uniref:Uncharacterized protein n=1 Tax=Polychaeton citri CBS 116435 TaxID=1314669 RepID=A0A9P4Q9R0_9PEZI|nr:hypothetical protein K431DRAFT_58924 [Polychaeton citri CBS 116435]